MKNNNDQRAGVGSSKLSQGSNRDAQRRNGSLLSFPGSRTGLGESPAERHARARSRKESRPSDLLGALAHTEPQPGPEPVRYAPEPDLADEPSLLERLMRKGKTSTTIPRSVQADDRVGVSARPNAYTETPVAYPQTVEEPSAYQSARMRRDDDEDDRWKPLIDPMRVISGILDAKGLIIALTLLGAGLGAVIAFSTPKKFEATAEILIDPRDLRIGDRPLTEVEGLPSDSTIALVENQVRVLTSSPVYNKVVEKLNLESDPDFNGQGLDLNPLNFIRGLLSRDDGASGAGRRRAETVTALAKSISVERTGRTFTVLVSAETTDAEKSALIANEVINAFLEVSGKLQSDSANRANGEVVAQLDRLRGEVEAAEQKVEKYRTDNDLAVAQGRLITDDEIIRLNDQLAAARARTIELNARAETARQMSADAVVGGAIPEAASSSTVNDLRAQYAAAKQEADRISVRLGPRHPSYQSAQAQVAAVRDQISTELRRVAAQVQTELRRSVQLEQDLAARLAQLKVRQGNVSNEMVMLRDLERDAQAKRSVYEAFLLRAKETSEQAEINSANISVISAASPPLRSSGMSRMIMIAAGALAGMLAGIGIGALRGMAGGLSDTWRNSANQAPNAGGSPSGTRMPTRNREDEYPVDEDEPMNPPYPPHGYAAHPQKPMAQQPQYAHPGYAQPVYPQQAYAQPPMAPVQQPVYPQHPQPYPQQAPYTQPQPYQPQAYPQQPPAYLQPQAYAQPWPPAPPQPVYAQPVMPVQPVYTQPYPAPVQPAQPASQEQAGTLASITDSVREFRDAVRELTENRVRRRYF